MRSSYDLPPQPNDTASDYELKQSWPPKYYRGFEVSLNDDNEYGIYYMRLLSGNDSVYAFDKITDEDVKKFKNNSKNNSEAMQKAYELYYQNRGGGGGGGGGRRKRKSQYKKRTIKHKRNNTKKYRRRTIKNKKMIGGFKSKEDIPDP
jgi:hypothetical protein